MVKELTTTKTEINILAIGLKIKKMVWVFSNIRLELYTMANGSTIKLVTKGKSFTPIKTNMKV